MPDQAEPNDKFRFTINTYDQIAADFVARHQKEGRWKTVIPVMQDFMNYLSPDDRVLDLGCGPGQDTEILKEHGYRAIGADLSWGMLKQARQHTTGEFIQADMRFLPISDGYFDAVWMCASLLHLPRTEAPRALSEANRILRKNGIIHVSLKEGKGEKLKTNLGERYFTYYTVDEIRTLVDNSGFTIQHEDINTYRDEGWIALIMSKN